ncbi:MAG: hypothetical protein GYB64_09690 [Chloroflexi bacterium]|nr:hypothetical protein [Chloroflexota bacterium]
MFEWLTPPGVPDSVSHMLLGYAFIFGTGIAYAASLVFRRRSQLRDLVVLEEINKDN